MNVNFLPDLSITSMILLDLFPYIQALVITRD